MEIVQYPHPALRWKSKPLPRITPELSRVVRQMFDLMYEHKGIGLAANQVAIPWRVFILNLTGDRDRRDEEFVFINPEITERHGTAESEEGCLSFPKLYAPVTRPERIVVEAYDLDGEAFGMELDDLAARAVQHETDHLDGVLFIDRMPAEKVRELDPVLEEFTSAYRKRQETGDLASDDALAVELKKLEP